jgi:PAS domain S-box-containing protein
MNEQHGKQDESVPPKHWQSVERLEKVSRLKEELLAPGSLDEKLKRITDGVVEIFDADFARIWVVEDNGEGKEGRCLHLHASSGRYTHIDGFHRRVPLGAYKIGRVASGEIPEFITNDVVNDPQVHDHEWAKKLGLVSFAGFRLLSPEVKPIGVIALFSKHIIDDSEVALLKDIANVTSHVVLTGMAEKALRESEKKLRRLYDSMTDAYSSTDLAGNLLDFNDAFVDLVGYSEEELRHMTFRDLTPPKWHALENQILEEQVLKRGGSDLYEKEYIKKDGTVFPVELQVYLILDDNGNPAGYWAIVRDITERKKTEIALKESERRLADIINFLPDATLVIDNEGKVMAWNRAMEELTGVKSEEMIGKGDYEYSVPIYGKKRPLLVDMVLKPFEEVKKVYECVKAEGSTLVAETYTPMLKPGGAYLWFRSTPLYGANGEVVGSIESIRDVTDRKLAEDYKREFYRRTIMAATEGKLLMTDADTVYQVAGDFVVEFSVSKSEDVGEIRKSIEKIAVAEGMDESKIADFAVAISEASTNALKHAGEGFASLHKLNGALMFVVKDCGPGIEAMTIPQVAFVRGYTTAGTLGMGYKIIISLSDQVYLATSAQGTTVGIKMDLHAKTKEDSEGGIDWIRVSI